MSTLVIFCGICGLFFIWLLINGKLSKISLIFSGFCEKFIMDSAKTPDGAFAIYSEAIDKQADVVSGIKQVLAEITGEYEVLKRETCEYEQKSKSIEQELRTHANHRDFNAEDQTLIILAESKFQADELIEVNKKSQIELSNKIKEIQAALEVAEKKFMKLKDERTFIVNELKRNKRLEKVYTAANGITQNDNLDKMVSSIKDGLRDSSVRSLGAQIVHEKMVTTQLDKAHKQAINAQATNYLKSLKK